MFCTQCGVSNAGENKFCSSCGAPTTATAPVNEQIVEIAIRQLPAASVSGNQSQYTYSQLFDSSSANTYSGLTMGAAIKSVFSKWGVFQGRATRSEYWFFALFSFLIYLGIFALTFVLATATSGSEASGVLFLIFLVLWSLVIFVPTISVTVRRLHDAGYSGWLYLLILVPYLGGFVIFIFSILVSQTTDNKWGRAPQPYATKFV